MERTQKPTIAGIVLIVIGVVFILWGIDNAFTMSDELEMILPPMIVAILPIVGGYFALRRKIWGLALAGAISSLIFTFMGLFAHGVLERWGKFTGGLVAVEFVLGILAIVLVALSKKEFS